MSLITQEKAEQIKVILSKVFSIEPSITSSMNGKVVIVKVQVPRAITRIDIQNLSIIPWNYTLKRSGTGITVSFSNDPNQGEILGYNSENETFNFADFKIGNDKILLP